MILGDWRDGKRAPFKMIKGAAVVDGNTVYFMSSFGDQVFLFDFCTQRWSKLPKCPHWCSSLAVIRGLLTTIGGFRSKGGTEVNKLLSLVTDTDKKWVKQFPPMPTKRHSTATVTTKQNLIVAGGEGRSVQTNTVEVMDIQTLVWLTAASLPHPYSHASAAICGDHLYMLGGVNMDGTTKSLLTCSLTNLLQSCSETPPGSVWYRVADVPVYESTRAAINGELVAIGGKDIEGSTDVAVYKYNPTTNSWSINGVLPTGRRHCLVAVLPTNEVMLVGGYVSYSNRTDLVEIASIHWI
jgi:N-acetylneuraminic acid mutarotase